jgi:hypothetical protein
LKTCPACKKSIDVEATKCPYCHTVFDAEAMLAGREEVGGRRRRSLVLLAAIIAAVFAWLAWPGSIEKLSDSVADLN